MIYWIKKFFSNAPAHRSAFFEVLVVMVFTLIPSLITFSSKLSHQAAAAVANHSVSAAMAAKTPRPSLLTSSEMFLLAYGIYGTVFWLSFGRADKQRHDARIALGAIATLLTFLIVGFMGIDPTFSRGLSSEISRYGPHFYLAMNFIYYLLLFYLHIEPPSPRDVLHREADRMLDAFHGVHNS